MVSRRTNQPHYDALCLAAHRLWRLVLRSTLSSIVTLYSQCARREITCEYPKESKRGQYRRQQYLERVGKEVAEKIAEVERIAADVERNGGNVVEVQGHIGSGRRRNMETVDTPEHLTLAGHHYRSPPTHFGLDVRR